VIAAQPVDAWEPSLHTVAEQIGVDTDIIRTTVWPFIHTWNNDPTGLAEQQLGLTHHVRERLTSAANARRWEPLATEVDSRLVADPQWRQLAAALHEAHTHLPDVRDAITVALEDSPLNPEAPAADLAGRLQRLTYPEPFTDDPEETLAHAQQGDIYADNRPNRDRGPLSW